MEDDPALNFFSASELDSQLPILYVVLDLLPADLTAESSTKTITSALSAITQDQVKRAYRKQALKCHPDKAKPEEKEDAEERWKRVGFAYSVLGDEKRKAKYDATNSTSESSLDTPEQGWDAYFAGLFKKVDKRMLDEDKERYQGSDEERSDLLSAYEECSGDFVDILARIPHSTHADEERLAAVIDEAIKRGDLKATSAWKATSRDKKARQKRRKDGLKEAKEAEQAAREMGVWDDFYGDKNGSKKKSGGKGDDDGESALAAIIAKRKADRGNALDAMLAKYGGKKGDEPSDAEFEAIQARMKKKPRKSK